MMEAKKKKTIKKYAMKIGELLIAAFLGYVIALWQYNVDERKNKKELYLETKTICDQLNIAYKQLLLEMIEVEFYGISKRKNLGGGVCIPLEQPSVKRKPLDQYLLNVDDGRKNLLSKLNDIELYFDINKELENEMIHLRKSQFNNPPAFQKVRLCEISDCDDLRVWRDIARKQGMDHLEKWFYYKYNKLLNGIKNQF